MTKGRLLLKVGLEKFGGGEAAEEPFEDMFAPSTRGKTGFLEVARGGSATAFWLASGTHLAMVIPEMEVAEVSPRVAITI